MLGHTLMWHVNYATSKTIKFVSQETNETHIRPPKYRRFPAPRFRYGIPPIPMCPCPNAFSCKSNTAPTRPTFLSNSQTLLPQSPFNPHKKNLTTPSYNGRTRQLSHNSHPCLVRLIQPVLIYCPSHSLPWNVSGSFLRKTPSTIYGYPSEIEPPF